MKDIHFKKINGHEHASIDSLDFGWKIRFTPDEVGLWSFSIHAIDQDGETIDNTFGDAVFFIRKNYPLLDSFN